MPAYYNEFDPYAAQWLRNLIAAGHIAPGDVDERSIVDVQPDDLRGYEQVHFFAGIGGWSLALRLAMWPDDRPVWTGSCPCQPFSAAGKRKGHKDERHLWPVFRDLIEKCRPPVVFGEQVASSEVVGTELEAAFAVAVQSSELGRANKLAKRLVANRSFHFSRRWIDGVHADMEGIGYAFGFAVLGAHSVGAPHIRQRLYWVANANVERAQRIARDDGEAARLQEEERPEHRAAVPQRGSAAGGVADANGGIAGDRHVQPSRQHGQQQEDGRVAGGVGNSDLSGREAQRRVAFGDEARPSQLALTGSHGGLGRADDAGSQGRHDGPREGGRADQRAAGATGVVGHWSNAISIPCADGKARRVEPGIFPLAHGVPGRVGKLRAAGNAIVPQVAAEFIRAWVEA